MIVFPGNHLHLLAQYRAAQLFGQPPDFLRTVTVMFRGAHIPPTPRVGASSGRCCASSCSSGFSHCIWSTNGTLLLKVSDGANQGLGRTGSAAALASILAQCTQRLAG